jgi:hypothetical protein
MATQPINNSEDHRELVTVFETVKESEALVIKGLLDAAGIESLLTAEAGPIDVLPGVGILLIRTAAEFADQARCLIEDYCSGNEAEMVEQNKADQSTD